MLNDFVAIVYEYEWNLERLPNATERFKLFVAY